MQQPVAIIRLLEDCGPRSRRYLIVAAGSSHAPPFLSA
jgi:hypothetical protein